MVPIMPKFSQRTALLNPTWKDITTYYPMYIIGVDFSKKADPEIIRQIEEELNDWRVDPVWQLGAYQVVNDLTMATT